MNKECPCSDCNPNTFKRYINAIIPLLIIITGVVQISLGTVISGITIGYLLRKINKLENQIENCGCWY